MLIINASGMRDKGRLRNSSRLNENRDMTTKHAVILDNTLNKKKSIKNIIGAIDGIEMWTLKCGINVSVLNLIIVL